MFRARFPILAVLALLVFAFVPDTAFAYVGPGAGLSAIGTLFALVSAVFLGIVGFVWYPVKRLLRRKPQDQPGRRPRPETPRERP